MQRQNARADETGGQHDGRRGALNHRRDEQSQQKADDRIIRYLFHRLLQRGRRTLLQTVAHQTHSVEKQCQSAEEGNEVENCHALTTRFIHYALLDLTPI